MPVRALVSVLTLLSSAAPAVAAEALDGASFGLAWALPFVGILLSIALFPLFAPHSGSITGQDRRFLGGGHPAARCSHGLAGRSGAVRTPCCSNTCPSSCCCSRSSRWRAASCGGQHPWLAGHEHGAARHRDRARELHRHDGRLHGDDPADHPRQRRPAPNAHVVVFFIFLVSNIGGSLTPLGDPPLFLGFLRGVDFFWTTSTCCPRRCSSPACCSACSSRSTLSSTARRSAAPRPDAGRASPPAGAREPGPDRRHHRRHPDQRRLEAGRGLLRLRRHDRTAERLARPHDVAGHVRVARADAGGRTARRTGSPGGRSRRWRSSSPASFSP